MSYMIVLWGNISFSSLKFVTNLFGLLLLLFCIVYA